MTPYLWNPLPVPSLQARGPAARPASCEPAPQASLALALQLAFSDIAAGAVSLPGTFED